MKQPYHDNSRYYDDDDDFEYEKPSQSSIQLTKDDSPAVRDFKNKVNHNTDTKNYNPLSFDIISPEQAQAEFDNNKRLEDMKSEDYADPVIAKAVFQIEQKIGRKINYDEFDKLCKTYAAELVQQDAMYKGNGETPNPVDYRMYYETLIQNRALKPASKMRMEQYENSLVSEIDSLYQSHRSFDDRDLNIKRGDAINIRHKGNVIIRDEERNKEIKINNKNDVSLLHMKYREEWLEKKYKQEIDKEVFGDHSNDGFE